MSLLVFRSGENRLKTGGTSAEGCAEPRPSFNKGSPRAGRAALVGAIDPHPDLPACAGCGRCCHWVVELRPDDVVPEKFIVEREGARCLDQRSDGACVALDPKTKLCTIYETRPQTCRDFHRGESLCRTVPGRSAPVSI